MNGLRKQSVFSYFSQNHIQREHGNSGSSVRAHRLIYLQNKKLWSLMYTNKQELTFSELEKCDYTTFRTLCGPGFCLYLIGVMNLYSKL